MKTGGPVFCRQPHREQGLHVFLSVKRKDCRKPLVQEAHVSGIDCIVQFLTLSFLSQMPRHEKVGVPGAW